MTLARIVSAGLFWQTLLMQKQDIIVVGAGLVGSLLALMLGRRGHRVRVFERRSDMRNVELVAGRSINLALSDRGIAALKAAGLDDEVQALAIPMRGRRMHAKDGARSFQPYGVKDQAINSISRSGLNVELMNASEAHEKVDFHFEKAVKKVDFKNKRVHFHDGTSAQGDVILGADGCYSAVRLSMQLSPLRLNYSQDYLDHGYKELHIPPVAGAEGDARFALEPDGLHIWPRGTYMVIALPNLDGSFTVTLFMPYASDTGPSFNNIQSDEDIAAFFEAQFPDLIPLIPGLVGHYRENPVGDLQTIRCAPYHYEDAACLLGDAAHAIVPFYGQGMNSGFEDCRLFCEMFDESSSWKELFERFSTERKKDADAIADLALYNYIEMRDLTSDPRFLLQKKIEAKISAMYGEKYLPLYSMVTFSHLPYSEAQKRGGENEEMMHEIMSQLKSEGGTHEDWQSPAFEKVIRDVAKTRGLS